MTDQLLTLLSDLTGQSPPFPSHLHFGLQFPEGGLGWSQLNELLLLLGYDRISDGFFQFLVDGTVEIKSHDTLSSLEKLQEGIDRFRKLAILRFGNVKFGFKYFSAPSTNLRAELSALAPIDVSDFNNRHTALLPVETIPGDKTYYLGYLIKRELDRRLLEAPDNEEIKLQLAEREKVVEKGKLNQRAYLVSDHLDVYVATSMRERHEYLMVNQVVKDVFESPLLSDLRLRYFDPTQAFCDDRIDKGLAEGLMLKRAVCTLYLAQESDTLGKDSELASTLAQGKTVIAYIPQVDESGASRYVDDLIDRIRQVSLSESETDVALHQLRVFEPAAAWTDQEVMRWVADSSQADVGRIKARLAKCVRQHYEYRAKTLKESHPLGIQVHLETGVANGVLVARTPSQCAELIRRIMTGSLEFDICEDSGIAGRYLLLKERLTGSIFRVVSGDQFLTNAFWNFYLPK
ncbi:hypothetical protein B7486_09500 [cyanobacterium TDX16]|nr:hypothetical protein B7486_09500 [cyanobacterium TDX16]